MDPQVSTWQCTYCDTWAVDGGEERCGTCNLARLDTSQMVPCLWASQHAGMRRGKAGCPACRGSGWVEAEL